MSKHFIILIVFSVIAIGAVLTVLVVSNRSLTPAPTASPTVTKTDALTSGTSNKDIETDIKNTKIDDTDSDLAPTEKNIKSL